MLILEWKAIRVHRKKMLTIPLNYAFEGNFIWKTRSNPQFKTLFTKEQLELSN